MARLPDMVCARWQVNTATDTWVTIANAMGCQREDLWAAVGSINMFGTPVYRDLRNSEILHLPLAE